MARAPAIGRAKRRIAASLGDAAADALYRAFLTDASRWRLDPSWTFYWALAPAARLDAALGGRRFAQRGADLGARMAHAMATVLALGHRRCVLVGADVPHLPTVRLHAAFVRLESGADLVLGPAADGGYTLVGASSVPPIFDGIEWGGAEVLERTLARASSAGLAVSCLPEFYDLDTEDDLRRLRSSGDLGEAPATAAELARLFSPGQARSRSRRRR